MAPSSPSSSSSSESFPLPSSNFASLPVAAMKRRIVEKILENRVTLIVGEPGCGTYALSRRRWVFLFFVRRWFWFRWSLLFSFCFLFIFGFLVGYIKSYYLRFWKDGSFEINCFSFLIVMNSSISIWSHPLIWCREEFASSTVPSGSKHVTHSLYTASPFCGCCCC